MIDYMVKAFQHTRYLIVFIIFLSKSDSFYATGTPVAGYQLLEKVFDVNRSIKSLSMTMLIEERIGTDYVQKKTDFKISFQRYRVYLKQYYPNEGMEILYLDGENNGKALVNRNTIAFSSFKFDPLGNAMRKGNHHSILKAGFSFFLDVLEHLYEKYKSEGEKVWHYQGIVLYGGIRCHKITVDIPSFKFIKYTVCEGENLESLSRKLYVCDYMIYEHNAQINSFDNLKAGQEIVVPSDYAKQIVVYIDEEKLVPLGVKAYDDAGLFEEYSYLNIIINPTFEPIDFDSRNPAYGFR
jgi:hypothetical protein